MQYMRCGVPLVQVTMDWVFPDHIITVWYGEAEWPSKCVWLVPGASCD